VDLAFEIDASKKRKPLPSLWRSGLLLLALVILVEAVHLGWHVGALAVHATRLRTLARNPGDLLQAQGPARVKAELGGIEVDLRALRAQLSFVLRPACPGRGPLAPITQNLGAVDLLLGVGADLARIGQGAADGLQGVADVVRARPAGQSTSEALFAGLVQARPYLREAALQLGRPDEVIGLLVQVRLWPPLARGVALLDHYVWLARMGLGGAVAAPTLLGEDGPVTYMLLAQNSDELRASGGFISTISLLTLERGKLGQLEVKDSYAYDQFTVDHPFAPEPMQRHMGIILWTTRDGNWSPDFPTTVRDVESLYHLENTGAIDGVMAFDLQAVQAVLRAVGPLELEQYGDRVDADNVLGKMREYWSAPTPEGWREHRKDFVGVMASALLQRLQSPAQLQQLGGLLQALRRTLQEKHVQLYFYQADAQQLLASGGWDGSLAASTRDDYLLALDTNMGYNKVNVNVDKRIEYQVTLGRSMAPTATLTITYVNHSVPPTACMQFKDSQSYAVWMEDCYWNYLRLYVPRGSQLLATEGLTETETLPPEKGHTVWGAFLLVPGGESRTVRFTYRLPEQGARFYSLLVQKQAGTDAVPCAVHIVLPEGAAVLSSSPAPRAREDRVLSYDLDLRVDRSLELTLQ
jgi:hypothetical protein